jgi:hypothetical protein
VPYVPLRIDQHDFDLSERFSSAIIAPERKAA